MAQAHNDEDKVRALGDASAFSTGPQAVTLDGTEGDDKLVGTDGSDNIDGGSGDDLIQGLGARDLLSGGGGDDRIEGGLGADRIDGEDGADTMIGNLGNDTYIVGEANDEVIENAGQGTDTVISGLSLTLFANVENLTLEGSDVGWANGNGLNNTITSDNDSQILHGRAGNDVLRSGEDHDRLFGQAGNDVLVGGDNRDTLRGGAGRDQFRYLNEDHSGVDKGNRDVILDFDASDIIDLRNVDANEEKDGNQAFIFIGNAAFSDRAGELRWDDGILKADLDGNGESDFEISIHFNGITKITEDDILL